MSIYDRYSNADLAVEESRKSRMLPKDRQAVYDAAFSGNDEYTTRLLRKCVYEMNLDEQIMSEFASSANHLLNELEQMKNKPESLREAEHHLRDCLYVRSAMYKPGNEMLLHDETTGGWHHPDYREG
ncbi:hypothetical protein WMW72_26150 [Paenibacillus filicis]|uniref:Uncharacterized protein n=1 Tax=Paenibacillus filicis TaxID=669464 RepID=A0ABU9DT96_9BACL